MTNRKVNQRMAHDRAEHARLRLTDYFRLVAEKAGVNWDSDNDAEVSEIIDLILEAAEYQAELAAARESTGLPASIQEALNSGDGTYRP